MRPPDAARPGRQPRSQDNPDTPHDSAISRAYQAVDGRLDGALGRAVLAVFVWILAAALWTLVAFR
jgi:hypothetical protein